MDASLKQHLIDPEICIRCNTCEATCPIGAITHDDNNYVVRAESCNFCMDCVAPCPTGAIDNWFQVAAPFSLDEQYGWSELPPRPVATEAPDALEDEAAALLAHAHSAVGGRARAPASASKPRVNLFNRGNPALAKVTGNIRVTRSGSDAEVHHLILDFGTVPFPVLEGQSIGVIPPGIGLDGKPHPMRLYSLCSARDGERPNTNNLALTVKRVPGGVASPWLCDLKLGESVPVVGPFGATFLMPDDPDADIIMLCTGTGAAPFRGFTERRRRLASKGRGRLHMFFGARTPEELPYFGPLQKVPASLLHQELVYSRLPGQPKEYVQARLLARAADLAALLGRDTTYIYVCGLKGLEAGVEDAFVQICAQHRLDWPSLRAAMLAAGRYHVETY